MLRWWRKEKYLRKSDQLYKSGKHDEAIAHIDEALERYPHLDVWKQKIWLLKEVGRLDEAIERIASLLPKHAQESVLHLLLGEVLILKGDYPRARESLLAAIEFGGENIYAEYLIGKSYVGTGEMDKAGPYFESMIKYDKHFVSSRLLAVAELQLMERKKTYG